ncbi:MAG: DUF664 domain-containing protein [Nocardioides sp.]
MTPADLLVEAFDRILQTGLAAVDGLEDEALAARPAPEANPVGWLVWHLARVQDDHIAGVAGAPGLEQVWTSQGWADRFGLPLDVGDIGYGHTTEQVASVRVGAGLLADYLRAVHAQTVAYVAGLSGADLDEVVDERWDPPVTRGVRLVSVVGDDLQHAGQAAYVRGLHGR